MSNSSVLVGCGAGRVAWADLVTACATVGELVR